MDADRKDLISLEKLASSIGLLPARENVFEIGKRENKQQNTG